MEPITDQLTVYNIASTLLAIIGILSTFGIARNKKLLRDEIEGIIQDVRQATHPRSPGGENITKEETLDIIDGSVASLDAITDKYKGKVSNILGAIADFLLSWKGS